MSEYKYTSPLDDGYKQIFLTKNQHNRLFLYRKMRWCDRYEYYINDEKLIVHRFVNVFGIIVMTLLFPVSIFNAGFQNAKDVSLELKHMYSQKKYGVFSSDVCYKGSNTYEQIKSINQ